MKKYGWEPVIYTPENPAFDVKDPSLLRDVPQDITVLKHKISEPIEVFQSAFRVLGKKPPQQKDLISDRNASFFQRAATYIRGNYFIPDPRITWVKPSVKYLLPYLDQNPADVIITTGPPHSMHLIGQEIKKEKPEIFWVADFRDPWSEWDLLDMLKTGKSAKAKHKKMEASVLRNADLVVSISPYHVGRLKALGAKRCELVNNGYDARDFETAEKIKTGRFVIRHLGSIDDLRDPRPFMSAVQTLMRGGEIGTAEIAIEFIGPVNNAFKEFVQADPDLASVTSFHPAVPHSEVVSLYGSSTLLLLILAHTDIAAGNMPGKMYEYMASGTPVLGIGPENGDAAALIRQTGSGEIIDRDNINAMSRMIREHFHRWKNNEMIITGKAPEYSRDALTGKFCSLLP